MDNLCLASARRGRRWEPPASSRGGYAGGSSSRWDMVWSIVRIRHPRAEILCWDALRFPLAAVG
jgi:hypothetical protein